jgi:hypothetical protein
MRQAGLGSNFPANRKKLPSEAEMAEIPAACVNHFRMMAVTPGIFCRMGQELPPSTWF